jgi:hypothetical protein
VYNTAIRGLAALRTAAAPKFWVRYRLSQGGIYFFALMIKAANAISTIVYAKSASNVTNPSMAPPPSLQKSVGADPPNGRPPYAGIMCRVLEAFTFSLILHCASRYVNLLFHFFLTFSYLFFFTFF